MSLRCLFGFHAFRLVMRSNRKGRALECARCRHRMRVGRNPSARHEARLEA